jgi:hypothetical protein
MRPGRFLGALLLLVWGSSTFAEAPKDLAAAIRTAATDDLVDAAERHETVFWGAERAARFQGLGQPDHPFSQALARAVFVSYHEIDHAALLDPARRGSDPAFDREALLVLDLVHGWLASLSHSVVLGGRRDPVDVPLPDHEVVLRFLERARLPVGDDFVRHARLVGLRFLDRVGHSDLVLGRPVFLDLPQLAEEWSRYEAGEREPPEPEQGLPGEPIDHVAAVAQEYLNRTETMASAFTTLGDARHAGFEDAPLLDPSYPLPPSLVRRALPPAPLAPPPERPAPPPEPEGPNALTWVLLGGVVLVSLRMAADLARPREEPEAAPDPARTATVVAPSDSFDEIHEEGAAVASDRGVAAPGVELPAWLLATLERPLGGRYQDLEVLGTCRAGTVVGGRDSRRPRDVIVLVPPPQQAGQPEVRERFLREARAIARFDHPGVIRVLEVPEVGEADVPVMIMERLEGLDLAARAARSGPAPTTEVCQWVVQAASALDHAHAQGVLHRDVKPENLVLTGENRIKLLGFDPTGESQDHLEDQYDLGVTAYGLLAQQAPFDEGDGVRTRPRDAAGRGDGLHPKVDEVFARVLHPDPTQRFGSCADFASALLMASQGLGPR